MYPELNVTWLVWQNMHQIKVTPILLSLTFPNFFRLKFFFSTPSKHVTPDLLKELCFPPHDRACGPARGGCFWPRPHKEAVWVRVSQLSAEPGGLQVRPPPGEVYGDGEEQLTDRQPTTGCHGEGKWVQVRISV